MIKKYWVKKRNDDISIYNLALHLWFFTWESKKGYTAQEITKSLANRKDFVIKFPNASCPWFLQCKPKKPGIVCRAGFGIQWMTMPETHTLGNGYMCMGEGRKAEWSCALFRAWFQPNPSQRNTVGTEKKKRRGALHQMCISNTKDAPPSNPDQPQCLQSCSSSSDTSKSSFAS